MTEKRFVGNFYKGMLISIYDKVDDKNVNILQMVEIANQVVIENEQLKKELERCRKCLNDDLDVALGFIKSKGYSLKDLENYRNGDE